MKVLKVVLTEKSTGIRHEALGEFEDQEMKDLRLFEEVVEKLTESKMLKRRTSMQFNYSKEDGTSVTTTLPPEDEIDIFLHRFRPIGLQKERTYFPKICKILKRRFDNDLVRKYIEEQMGLFDGKQMQSMFTFQSKGVILNSDKVLYDWLNAYQYHRDEDKKSRLESLHKIFPLEASKGLFIFMLDDKARAAHNISRLIKGMGIA